MARIAFGPINSATKKTLQKLQCTTMPTWQVLLAKNEADPLDGTVLTLWSTGLIRAPALAREIVVAVRKVLKVTQLWKFFMQSQHITIVPNQVGKARPKLSTRQAKPCTWTLFSVLRSTKFFVCIDLSNKMIGRQVAALLKAMLKRAKLSKAFFMQYRIDIR